MPVIHNGVLLTIRQDDSNIGYRAANHLIEHSPNTTKPLDLQGVSGGSCDWAEPVTVRLTVPALTAIGASVTLASDDTAIADFVMWEAELMEDLNPDSVEEMFPIPRAEAHA
ncbi:MAG: hypothetical protein E7H84_04275 [Bifidobacterium breve]|nr:hypothetical protein [Bifidobacterium breve]